MEAVRRHEGEVATWRSSWVYCFAFFAKGGRLLELGNCVQCWHALRAHASSSAQGSPGDGVCTEGNGLCELLAS